VFNTCGLLALLTFPDFESGNSFKNNKEARIQIVPMMHTATPQIISVSEQQVGRVAQSV
jgi:hypothetical protein